MAPSNFMTDARRLTKTALEVHGRLQVRLELSDNDTWLGYIEDPRLGDKDDIGALYYVIAVIFIYGMSIVMMIASHIRKNKQDCQLRSYLKEMAILRKADRRDKLMERITAMAATTKVKGVFKGGEGEGQGRGLFRLSSKASLKLGSKRSGSAAKDLAERGGEADDLRMEEGDEGGGGGGGGDEGDVESQGGVASRARTREGAGEAGARLVPGVPEGEDDSDYLDTPVHFALHLNRLSPDPSATATPLTSPSVTPSPPPRQQPKPTAKITFIDEGYVL